METVGVEQDRAETDFGRAQGTEVESDIAKSNRDTGCGAGAGAWKWALI